MKKQQLNIIIIILVIISGLFFSSIAFKCSQYNFLKTTAFYFNGITCDEIGDIKATGFDKKLQAPREIYCLENQINDKYIYKDWRYDFVYYDFIDSIILKIPDSLFPKIEKIWFKCDKTVTEFSNEEFVKTWSHKNEGKNIIFFVPESLHQKNSFYDGLMCLVYKKGQLFRAYRYALLISFIVLVLLTFIRFFSLLKGILNLFFKAGNFIFTKYRKFFKRLLVFFLGLFFSLLILEVALRIVGYIHNSKNIEKQYKKLIDSKDLIICVGDSFTESLGSSDGNDYPSQLERMINQHAANHFNVLNFGRSGKNTAQILMEVPLYIKNYKPRLIVLMAGSANYWNYWGYKEKESMLYSLRSVNFFRLLIQGIRESKNKNVFDSEAYIIRRNNYILSHNKVDTAVSPLLKVIRTQDFSTVKSYADSSFKSGLLNETDIIHILIYSKLTGNNDMLETTLKNYKPKSLRAKFYFSLLNISTEKAYTDLLFLYPYYNSIYNYLNEMKNSKFNEESMRKCIELNPYFEDPYFQYYSLGHNQITVPDDYEQKRFSIIDSMNYFIDLLGFGQGSNVFKEAYLNETPEEQYEKNKIDNWVADNMENIIFTCKQNGVPVVLMNYPIKYAPNLFSSVNDVLKNIAIKNNIPFVDNGFIFNIIEKDRNSYFIPDGHCSDKGYELISKNLYKVLSDNKMLDN